MSNHVFVQMNREWEILSTTDVSCWVADEPALAQCSTAADVLAAIPCQPNEVLLFLVREAQAGNTLAGRIIIQTMIGKLIRMSISGRARSIPSADMDLVASLWERVMTLPLSGRLNNVAARLALDTLNLTQHLWSREEISRLSPEVATKLVFDVAPDTGDDDLRAADVLAMGEQWLSDDDAEVMRLLYGQGASVAEVAARLEVSPQKIYRRRQVGLSVLRDHADELLAA
ncbi:hypothetical protein [Luteococcus sp.]|uniref:hypothetical protein n=1 Tax=Luteococcus sp. TaxID=1969402 RepID=UPI003735B34D